MADLPQQRPVRRGRPWRGALRAAGIAAALYALLLAVGNAPPTRAALRARALARLAALVPGARLEGEPGLDLRLRIHLGALELPGRDGGPPLLRAAAVKVSPDWPALLRGRVEPAALRLEGVRVRLPGGVELPPFSARLRPGPPLTARLELEEGGRADLRLTPRGRGLADLELALERLTLRGEALGPAALGPLGGRLVGRLAWSLAEGQASLSGGRLSLGPGVEVALSAAWEARPEPTARLCLRLDRVEWSALLAALPPPLRPPPGAPRLGGTVSFQVDLEGPPARPADWELRPVLDLRGLAPDGPVREAGPFTWRAPASAGVTRTIEVGPAAPDFVPLPEVPPLLAGAVLLAEDAGFHRHRGFDFAEIREALAERAGSGRVRGASTISQQVAKNLWLDGERTLARKAREALATVALEASLPKGRILEIYLNVAEWGPGLFGLGEAARHYFGKAPRDLRPKEAAFLASIIPSPVRYHGYFEKGELTPTWEERVRALLVKLRDAGLVSDAELLEAIAEPLAFARP